MSADNGIYICWFTKENVYRVGHGFETDVIWFDGSDSTEQEKDEIVSFMFRESKTFDLFEDAHNQAHALDDDIGTEYGIGNMTYDELPHCIDTMYSEQIVPGDFIPRQHDNGETTLDRVMVVREVESEFGGTRIKLIFSDWHYVWDAYDDERSVLREYGMTHELANKLWNIHKERVRAYNAERSDNE